MRVVWKCVTPGIHGINSTSLLAFGIEKFLKAAGVRADILTLDVKSDEKRVDEAFYKKCADFILDGLKADVPVAFLNLDNGQVANLSRWHWVVITKAHFTEDYSSFTLTVSDEGVKREIDFKKWMFTTFGGGGLLRVNV